MKILFITFILYSVVFANENDNAASQEPKDSLSISKNYFQEFLGNNNDIEFEKLEKTYTIEIDDSLSIYDLLQNLNDYNMPNYNPNYNSTMPKSNLRSLDKMPNSIQSEKKKK